MTAQCKAKSVIVPKPVILSGIVFLVGMPLSMTNLTHFESSDGT